MKREHNQLEEIVNALFEIFMMWLFWVIVIGLGVILLVKLFR